MSEWRRNKAAARYDIISQNFDLFFGKKLAEMTEGQKEMLDKILLRKAFGGKSGKENYLNFLEKAFILGTVYNEAIYILIANRGDAENALTPASFVTAAKALKGDKGAMGELVEEVQETGTFVVSTRELFDTVGTMNLACVSDLYRLTLPLASRKIRPNKEVDAYHTSMKFLIQFLSNYEGNKKRFETDYGLTMSDWYAMLYFYDKEKVGSGFYKDGFLLSVQSNLSTKKRALTHLSKMGYLFTRGKTNRKMYRLSPKGLHVMQQIFDRIVFNM
jgi:hypothetical protein